jgi:uncharacterized protein YndB with AHSA1/START domain
MADSLRRQCVIQAPVEDVWAIVSDPDTHPDWWPELRDVHFSGDVEEGAQYTRVTRRMGFLDMVDTVWVVEHLEQMKEVQFRCTRTGTYTRFAVTPAQDDTFVEIEAGMDPTSKRWKVAKAVMPRRFFQNWLGDLLDALPEAVRKKGRRQAA